jgi:hypothetical protein
VILNANIVIAQHTLTSARRVPRRVEGLATFASMTSAEIKELDTREAAARLRQLLTQIEDAATAPRSDPKARLQFELCAEIEAILRVRSEARPRQR